MKVNLLVVLADMEFSLISPQGKIGNLLASTKCIQFLNHFAWHLMFLMHNTMTKMLHNAWNDTFLCKPFMKLASIPLMQGFPLFLPQSELNLPRATLTRSWSILCLDCSIGRYSSNFKILIWEGLKLYKGCNFGFCFLHGKN